MVIFISFEGIDGAGKSTQVQILENFLRSKNFQICVTREPGGTVLGEKIRDILLKDKKFLVDPQVELCLMIAARTQHIKEVLLPALQKGFVIICDRFFDSTMAYQGVLEPINSSQILELSRCMGGLDLVPDITFFLDIEAKKSKERSSIFSQDRFTKRGLEYLNKVRDAYLEIMKKNPQRVHKIDASLSKMEIAQQIRTIVYENSFFLDQ